METWRRGILLACVCLALWTAKFAVLKPLLTVKTADFAEEQRDERTWTDDERRLKGLPLTEYIAEKTKGMLVTVSGPAWERLFAGVRAADAGAAGGGEWLHRAPADERRWDSSNKSYFFRPEEAPVADIAGKLSGNADRVTAALETNGTTAYVEVELHVFSADDFHFGSGFFHTPKPPASFLFPARRFSAPIALLWMAAYIFLPRRKKNKGAIFYPAWRNALGDFAAFLLIVPFFALPLLIVGGSVQAITRGWPFCLVFWPLAFLGVWLLRRMAWYAGYEIALRDDGIFLRTEKTERLIPFAEMDHFRPLDLRPPRWLVWAGALAALGGRGSGRTGAAGRAFLLAGFSNGGVGLGLKDGSSIFVWITDAMGTAALKNAGTMLKGLEKAGVRKSGDVELLRSIAPPTGKDRSGKIVKEGSERVVWILAALPIAAMLAFLLVAMFSRAF